MRRLSTLALSALALVTLSAATTMSAPISQDVCDELPVPFVVPGNVATDSELVDWLNAESATYCASAGTGTAWCACFAANLIRD